MRTSFITTLALACLSFVMFASGCAAPKIDPLLVDNMSQVRSVLIVPAVNESMKVTAPDYFLSTIPIPVAEQGYYVFPINMTKRLLEDNGLSDADMVHRADPVRLAALFDADTVLFIRIHDWDAKYVLLKTFFTVDLTYVLKNGKTGETIWTHTQQTTYQSGGGNSGNPIADLIASAIEAALAKAFEDSNCLDLARQANAITFAYPGPGLPPGPHKVIEEKKTEQIN